jgi:hypothetical protein
MLNDDPKRKSDLKLKLEPMCATFKHDESEEIRTIPYNEVALPKRAKLRTLPLEPIAKKSKVLSPIRYFARPYREAVLPSLKVDRRDTDDPNTAPSSVLTALPVQVIP